MEEHKELGGKVLTKPFMVCMALSIFAGILLIKRFIMGIGAVSNLSDGYPWGIWIAYDVMVGTAFACGGYALALVVYVFNRGVYHPLVRSALMASVFGYSLAGFSIVFDIGRYWQMYNIFLPWHMQFNSVMLEVALCIACYCGVLWIEFSPTFLEKMNNPKLLKATNKILFIFIAIGVLLPTMHQSSLGSLMLIAGSKVYPLWQTGFLPLLFLISAIAMGFSIVIFESILSSAGFRRPMETDILSKLSSILPGLLAVFFVVRFGDLIWRGQLGLMFRFNLQSVMFIIENALYLFVFVALANADNRCRPRMLFLSAVSLMLAGALTRFDTVIIGFNPGPGWHYFPSFSETMITVGVISLEIMAYLLFVKKLPVLPDLVHVAAETAEQREPGMCPVPKAQEAFSKIEN